MIPQYFDLKYFMVISETLNLSRASEILGVAQPTLSQAIKRLEEGAGVPLLIRRKTGVQLTRAGETLKQQSAKLVNMWQYLMKEVKEAETLPQGHFIIGAHPSVALYSLGKIFSGLLTEYEMIEISIVHGLSREILEGVVSSKIDFGLVINPRRHLDLVIKELCEDRVGFWKGKNSNTEILICDPALVQSQLLIRKMAARPFRRQIATSSLEVAADLVASGVGIGILPSRVALRFALKPCDDTDWVLDKLCLCYRKERQKSVAARKMIEAILKTRL